MANCSPDLIVDKQEQLEKIEGVCLPSETILAVFDLKGRGTGFLGITDKRLIYYDKEYLRNKKAMVSLPHHQISSVASEDGSGLFIKKGFFVSDVLIITPVGGEPKTFEFRGGEKAHIAHNMIMKYVLI